MSIYVKKLYTATNRKYQQSNPIIPSGNRNDSDIQMRKDLDRQKMLDRIALSEDKVNAKRNYRLQAQINKEREIEEALERSKSEQIAKTQLKEQEERLAKELERFKCEKLRDDKMRQQLRETSYELRELEAKLKEAYVNKERHAQMAEKEAHKFDEMLENAQILKRMKEEAERADRESKAREQNRAVEMHKFKQELHRQLEEKENAKQSKYEEFLRDKLLIDEIVRKIHEEDQKEIERKMLARQATKEYIEEFKKQRELWKQREQEIMEAENRKIAEYATVQKERDDVQKAHKKAKEEALEKLQSQLYDQIERDKAAREEMERVRQELYLEEQEELARNHERIELERKLRQRIELQKQYEEQMQLKGLREAAQRDEEEQIRKQMLDKFAQDDKLEQMNAQKRRLKQQEHKRAVESLLEERRQRIIVDKKRELDERVLNEQLDAYRRQIIEEERIKLLKEHAGKLLGYLPKGVIRDSKDLESLGDEFKQKYQKRQIDVFGDEGWTASQQRK